MIISSNHGGIDIFGSKKYHVIKIPEGIDMNQESQGGIEKNEEPQEEEEIE